MAVQSRMPNREEFDSMNSSSTNNSRTVNSSVVISSESAQVSSAASSARRDAFFSDSENNVELQYDAQGRQYRKRTHAHLTSDELALVAVTSAIEQKAHDIKALDVSEVCDIADRFLIISGTSQRHVRGIADRIVRDLHEHGERPITVTGYEVGDWVLIDCGDVVSHIFFEPVRSYYTFDELWSTGRRLSLGENIEKELKRLRTGVFT